HDGVLAIGSPLGCELVGCDLAELGLVVSDGLAEAGELDVASRSFGEGRAHPRAQRRGGAARNGPVASLDELGIDRHSEPLLAGSHTNIILVFTLDAYPLSGDCAELCNRGCTTAAGVPTVLAVAGRVEWVLLAYRLP